MKCDVVTLSAKHTSDDATPTTMIMCPQLLNTIVRTCCLTRHSAISLTIHLKTPMFSASLA